MRQRLIGQAPPADSVLSGRGRIPREDDVPEITRRALPVHGAAQAFAAEMLTAQALVDGVAESGLGPVELGTHARVLRALAGEQ